MGPKPLMFVSSDELCICTVWTVYQTGVKGIQVLTQEPNEPDRLDISGPLSPLYRPSFPLTLGTHPAEMLFLADIAVKRCFVVFVPVCAFSLRAVFQSLFFCRVLSSQRRRSSFLLSSWVYYSAQTIWEEWRENVSQCSRVNCWIVKITICYFFYVRWPYFVPINAKSSDFKSSENKKFGGVSPVRQVEINQH